MNKHKYPAYGWFGILLILLFWYFNWFLPGLRTSWAFFPLWLGFCLTIDSVVFLRKGTSLLKRNYKKYILLFVISSPVWWLFELFNSVTHNWIYDGKQYFSAFRYFILASISFSTVMPAVFETAELAGTFKWIRGLKPYKKLRPTKHISVLFFVLGLITLVLEIIYPEIFYPLIWITVYFLVEPLNILLGNRSLFRFTAAGNWKPVVSLCTGCLFCAFFWELWNFRSYPKWYYHLPLVNFLHVFEMPLPGYIGYLPFSLELYALYNLITGIFVKDGSEYVMPENPQPEEFVEK